MPKQLQEGWGKGRVLRVWCPFLPQQDLITMIISSSTCRPQKFDCNGADNWTHHSLKSWKGSNQTETQYSSCSAVTITQHISQFILWLTITLNSSSNTRLIRNMAKSTTSFWMRKMCPWTMKFFQMISDLPFSRRQWTLEQNENFPDYYRTYIFKKATNTEEAV